MLIVLPFCHKDILLAHRLMKWIGFLGEVKHSRILLVTTPISGQMVTTRQIASLAVRAFGRAHLHITDGDDERGWPWGPNYMFRQALGHVTEHFCEPFLWLEPDAVPTGRGWFSALAKGYSMSQKPFMGELVTVFGNRPHMSGVGFYGENWQDYAPRLAEDVNEPFDNWAGPQVVPHMHETRAIQHVFYSPPVANTGMLRPETLLYHQDKSGQLIKLLDKERFGGEMYQGKDDIVQETIVEPRFYHADNSNRVIKSNGHIFVFDSYGQLGGTWRGVYTTQDDAEVVALNAVVANPASGVTEISQQEYEAKKKATVRSLVRSHESPEIQLKPSPAVLVENPSPSLKAADAVNEAVQIDSVSPTEPPPAPPPVKRRRKTE